MRAGLLFIFLLSASLALSVKSKPHGKHHRLQRTSHSAKEKDVVNDEAKKLQVSPTSVPLEASSQEQGGEEMNSEDNTKVDEDMSGKRMKSTAVLLSEEELVDLLKKEEEAEDSEVGDDEAESDEALAITEDGPTSKEEKSDGSSEAKVKDPEVVREGGEDEKITNPALHEKEERLAGMVADRDEQVGSSEEPEGSTGSELPADLDYAADGGILPLQTDLATNPNPAIDGMESSSKKDLPEAKKEEGSEKNLPVALEDYEQDVQNSEAGGGEEDQHKDQDSSTKSVEISVSNKELKSNENPEELKGSGGFKSGSQMSETEEEKKNESRMSNKRKTRKPKKNQRSKKHSPQRNETHPLEDQNQPDPQESESSSAENVAQKTKRRRAGKWGPLVGVNPVQIRASVDLYPRSSFGSDIHLSKTLSDPCDNFRCKRGKTCKVDADGKPGCVCQQPSECPASKNEFDQVCGTDNKTYDTSCQLFAAKCNLEGTKKGHRLHLDYTGPCKVIPPCVDNELVQFPLRMRDWLKNVLLQLYEHDSVTPGFLTQKQRFKVKKIFENERRLHAGDHPVELLAQDFEKNYNMYIYPVHWQFAQLDQHPSDRFLSHSELGPLRVPLVPMEHCTSRFFQECDADKDKQVSFKEWTSCFGIKDDDMDVNLLF